MSVESFKKKYFHKRFQGVSTLEFKVRVDVTSDFLLERDPKELKYILIRTLEDMRIKLLSEFDDAFIELKRK